MQSNYYKGKYLNVFQQMFRGVSNLTGSDSSTSKVAACAVALFLVVMGLSVSFTMFAVLATSAAMLGFAAFLASWVLAKDEGVPEMQVVSDAIREGSEGFFLLHQLRYGFVELLQKSLN